MCKIFGFRRQNTTSELPAFAKKLVSFALILAALVSFGGFAAPGWAKEEHSITKDNFNNFFKKADNQYELNANVSNGDILSFETDIELDYMLSITKSVTIHGNGHTLSRSLPGKPRDNGSVIAVKGVESADVNVIIDGLTITGGNNNSDGGGMFISCQDNYQGIKVTVNNCTFTGNKCQSGGGGMFVHENAIVTVTNCTFTDNESTQNEDSNPGNGGGMSINKGASVNVINCTFAGNKSDNDGAEVYCMSGTLNAVNTIFWNGGNNYIALAKTSNTDKDPIVNLYNCAYGKDAIVELIFDDEKWTPADAPLWLTEKNKQDCVENLNWTNRNAAEVEGTDGMKHKVFKLTKGDAEDDKLIDKGLKVGEITAIPIALSDDVKADLAEDQLGHTRDDKPDIGSVEYVATSDNGGENGSKTKQKEITIGDKKVPYLDIENPSEAAAKAVEKIYTTLLKGLPSGVRFFPSTDNLHVSDITPLLPFIEKINERLTESESGVKLTAVLPPVSTDIPGVYLMKIKLTDEQREKLKGSRSLTYNIEPYVGEPAAKIAEDDAEPPRRGALVNDNGEELTGEYDGSDLNALAHLASADVIYVQYLTTEDDIEPEDSKAPSGGCGALAGGEGGLVALAVSLLILRGARVSRQDGRAENIALDVLMKGD